ncbi:hypothetical protein [Streptomyces sp. NPDC051665]|uniref:hypothetical protein n=1 Tax=Streptomyces sp. NPDC051665 TaxID=3154647 RepID=UPI0034240467
MDLATGADQDDAGPAGGGAESEDAPPVLAKVKEAPGNVSLETMLTELDKLLAVREIGLPPDLFIDVAPKVVAAWRARAGVESPSHLRTHPVPLRVTLLAALLHEREREITDTLVEQLISTVHRIGARAEKKVTEQLINAFKKESGKANILFKLAEASLGAPEGTVRQVVFPAVSGGEATLRELVHEFKTRGRVYRRTVQTTLKTSYTNHYRRGLIKLLDVLEFRSSNHAHRPVIEGPGAGGAVRERGEHDVLPAWRDGPGPQDDGWGLGGGRPPHRQTRPATGGAHGLRGRRLPGPARSAQVQGDLGGRRRQGAQPR